MLLCFQKRNLCPFQRLSFANSNVSCIFIFLAVESKCFMGIFPQLSSVWITIDHHLFIWDFESDSNAPLFMSHSFSSLIVSVALVRPKRGILSF